MVLHKSFDASLLSHLSVLMPLCGHSFLDCLDDHISLYYVDYTGNVTNQQSPYQVYFLLHCQRIFTGKTHTLSN
jgi:hypothetical protein